LKRKIIFLVLLILITPLTGLEAKVETLRVAVVQMESKNGNIIANLSHAKEFINQAAAKGAELILLPELMSTGYIFSTEIWDAAESKNGPTEKWMKSSSARLGVWIGTSYLEADGEDFFNTFVLTAPNGKIAGRVRKQKPAGPEAFFFKGDKGSHTISTKLGKIGVGICYENYLCFLPQLLYDNEVNLILMPHSAPIRELDGGPIASFYATLLGIPAIMVNKVGSFYSPPLRFLSPKLIAEGWRAMVNTFPGKSAIADSDGNIKAKMGNDEGILVEDIRLDSSLKTKLEFKCDNQWIKAPPYKKRQYYDHTENVGAAWYSESSERKQRALSISSKE
jgi:N-carbamoylputrescine amidase